MKNNFVSITAAVLLIIVAVLAITKCSQNLNARLGAESMLSHAEQRFEAFRTESGKNAAVAAQKILTYETLLAVKDRQLEKLKKQLGIRPKSLTNYVEVFVKGTDTLYLTKSEILTKDSLLASEPYEYRDDWNLFQAYQVGDGIELLYGITDSLYLVWDESSVKAMNSNPQITFTGLNSFEVPKKSERKKRFVVSAGLGYGATNDGLNAYLGVSAGYKLFEF